MAEPRIIEKRPGWDWDIHYIDEMEEGVESVETMTVYGCATVEAAIADARHSFRGLDGEDGEQAIVAVVRRAS